MNVLDKYLKGDKVIWAVVLLMVLFSVLVGYSSSANLAIRLSDGDATPYLFKHVTMLVLGVGGMFYMQHFDFKYLSRLSVLGIWVSVVLLLVTMVAGRNINSAQRWLLGFQPSDLAKIVLIIYVARFLVVRKEKLKSFKQGLVPIMIPIATICILIMPSDFSTAFLVFVICFTLLFVGGAAVKHLAGIVGVAVLVFGILAGINAVRPGTLPRWETWMSRISSFESGEVVVNYQANQAKIAIVNGGWLGNGPGKGSIKNMMYSAQSDFVYASILEDWGGMIGGIGTLLLYLILLFRSIKVATKTESLFGSYLVFGLSFSIVIQALINMGVGVNILPVTGQPLPLISMGGTSILFTCVSIGVILNVSRTVYKEQEVKRGNHAIA